MPDTPKQVLQKDNAERREKMAFRREDGLVIFLLKVVFNYRIWSWPYRLAVWAFLKLSGKLDKPTERPHLSVRHAADGYMLLMGVALLVCYGQLLGVARNTSADSRPVWTVVLWCILPVFRLIESFSVVVMLHANGPYQSPAPMRAVSKTLWAYLEFIVIFASIYVAVAAANEDKFGTADDPGFVKCWVNPLYFSIITIATVGYGDFAPQTELGRSFVAVEVFCGLVLLVVALQRVLSVSLPGQPPAEAGAAPARAALGR